MTHRIELSEGGTAWSQAASLLNAVWPPEVVATLPWRDVVEAHADLRVLVLSDAGDLVGHVGIFWRDALWDGRPVRVGGIGAVATREDCRRQGIASGAMRHAAQVIRTVHADFGVLFCEPRHAPVYQGLGWQLFTGDVFAQQPAGRVRFNVTDTYVLDLNLAPRTGMLDLCGLPW